MVVHSNCTLLEKIITGKERVHSLVIFESLLQSGVPILIDLIYHSLCRNQPTLLLSLEFSVQQWESWLGIKSDSVHSCFQILNIRTLFHSFESDPHEFFHDLNHYIHSCLVTEESLEAVSNPHVILIDSVDSIATDVIVFLRFLSFLPKSCSTFFCFTPTFHSNASQLALQHICQGYLELEPLPRTHIRFEAKDLFSESKYIHAHLSQFRCHLYLKKLRGKFVHEINSFELVSFPLKEGLPAQGITLPYSSRIRPFKDEDDTEVLKGHAVEQGIKKEEAVNILKIQKKESPTVPILIPVKHTQIPGRKIAVHSRNSSLSGSSNKIELDGLTFDLSLTPRQKIAKDEVKLPYLEAQSGASASGGWIHYSYDVNDDFDEDDPDADLEF